MHKRMKFSTVIIILFLGVAINAYAGVPSASEQMNQLWSKHAQIIAKMSTILAIGNKYKKQYKQYTATKEQYQTGQADLQRYQDEYETKAGRLKRLTEEQFNIASQTHWYSVGDKIKQAVNNSEVASLTKERDELSYKIKNLKSDLQEKERDLGELKVAMYTTREELRSIAPEPGKTLSELHNELSTVQEQEDKVYNLLSEKEKKAYESGSGPFFKMRDDPLTLSKKFWSADDNIDQYLGVPPDTENDIGPKAVPQEKGGSRPPAEKKEEVPKWAAVSKPKDEGGKTSGGDEATNNEEKGDENQTQAGPQDEKPKFVENSGQSTQTVPQQQPQKAPQELKSNEKKDEYEVISISANTAPVKYQGRTFRRLKNPQGVMIVLMMRKEEHIIEGQDAVNVLVEKGYFRYSSTLGCFIATTKYDNFMLGATSQSEPEIVPPQQVTEGPISVQEACPEFKSALGFAKSCQDNYGKNLEVLTVKSQPSAREKWSLECCQSHLEILHRCQELAKEGRRAADEGWKPDPGYLLKLNAKMPHEESEYSGGGTTAPVSSGSSQQRDNGTPNPDDMFGDVNRR